MQLVKHLLTISLFSTLLCSVTAFAQDEAGKPCPPTKNFDQSRCDEITGAEKTAVEKEKALIGLIQANPDVLNATDRTKTALYIQLNPRPGNYKPWGNYPPGSTISDFLLAHQALYRTLNNDKVAGAPARADKDWNEIWSMSPTELSDRLNTINGYAKGWSDWSHHGYAAWARPEHATQVAKPKPPAGHRAVAGASGSGHRSGARASLETKVPPNTQDAYGETEEAMTAGNAAGFGEPTNRIDDSGAPAPDNGSPAR